MQPITMTTIVIGKTGRRFNLGNGDRMSQSDYPPLNAFTEAVVKSVCCECGIVYANGEPGEVWNGIETVSHGYCPDCYTAVMAEMEE